MAAFANEALLNGSPSHVLTNLPEVRSWTSQQQGIACEISLQGVVLWISPDEDQLILGGNTGALRIKMDLLKQPQVHEGQKIRLEGRCVAGYDILSEVLVDNDGLHGPIERAGSIYLTAGRHPLCAEWFNGPANWTLSIEYEGPGLPRQKIPPAALFRFESNTSQGSSNFVQGLNYSCFEGIWGRLPNFAQLQPVKSGTVSDFDLTARTRDQDVGLQFTGLLEVPRSGPYTFWTKSDDGSRLFVDRSDLHITVLGTEPPPVPRRVTPGQTLPARDLGLWAETEGTVTFSHFDSSEGLELELNSGTNRMYLHVLDPAVEPPPLFSRIRVTGLCFSTGWSDGRFTADRMVIPGGHQLQILEAASNPRTLVATNVAQFRNLISANQSADCRIDFEGLVLGSSREKGIIAFQDRSGAALIKTDLQDVAPRAGQTVTLKGHCTLGNHQLVLGAPALVDNDGVHPQAEKSGTIFLNAGKHPLRVCWFNRDAPSSLAVYYQGPDAVCQRIPDTALFHRVVDRAGNVSWAEGLEYRCYEGAWTHIPAFDELQPAKAGISSNFDIGVASKATEVGLEFSGWLEVPRPGLYTFSTVSDDGSLLFIEEHPPAIKITGTNALPAPQPLVDRQAHNEWQPGQWSQAEGTVTFASEQSGRLCLDLKCDTGSIRVEVADPKGISLPLLLNSHIRAIGVCQSTYMPDGREVPGLLLAPGAREIRLLELAPAQWETHPVVPISRLTSQNSTEDQEGLVHIQGKARADEAGGLFTVLDETGQILVEAASSESIADGAMVEVLGKKSPGTNLLEYGFLRVKPGRLNQYPEILPTLTTVEQIKALSQEQALRGYPVKIRGVITAPQIGGFFIQDSTWAIYTQWQPSGSGDFPRAGDYWEVEGATYAEFAPNIRARRAARLGPGSLPEPFHPAWDQLINGSLDTLYVELRGVVTGIAANGVRLLTRDGTINIRLPDLPVQDLTRYENAVVRLRGCLIPGRDVATEKVSLGQVGLVNATLNVDTPAPADLFSVPFKRASDLFRFDPQASAIQRVKIAGQILHERQGVFYMGDGDMGLRFTPKTPVDLTPGDTVEAVGFPELSGPSPLLREAMVRRTGQAPLPAPEFLSDETLPHWRRDATRVRVQGRLVSAGHYRSEQVFELQTKAGGFLARLDTREGLLKLLPGSRLELTGIYSGMTADHGQAHDMTSFELLLNSPSDIRILEQPSWWNIQHTLATLAVMGTAILASFIWISVLHRQVEERTLQLAEEIRRREHSEHQRTMEEDRARIARDLHDDLGANLTRIGFLGELVEIDQSRDEVESHAREIAITARETVSALDEIVWAINPGSDTLDGLFQYLSHYVGKFFEETEIKCQLAFPIDIPAQPITAEIKHSLFLVVKEALNNVLKHSGATQVRLEAAIFADRVRIQVADNGRGFVAPTELNGHQRSGLSNMRQRVNSLGGTLSLESRPGSGTKIQLELPVPSASSAPHAKA